MVEGREKRESKDYHESSGQLLAPRWKAWNAQYTIGGAMAGSTVKGFVPGIGLKDMQLSPLASRKAGRAT